MNKLFLLSLALIAPSAHALEVGDTLQIPQKSITCTSYPTNHPCFGCEKPRPGSSTTLRVFVQIEEVTYFDAHFQDIACQPILAQLPASGPVNAVVTRKEILPPSGPSESGVVEIDLKLENGFRLKGRAARQ